MKNKILMMIAKRTIRYIKYLQNNGIEYLQDKEGNVIDIKNATNEMIKAWEDRPIKIRAKDKIGIYYKGRKYFLELQEKNEEIERLNNIIKEVREYIEENTRTGGINKDKKYFKLPSQSIDILEILDKADKGEK